jgi:hypothetical protein
MGNFGYMVSMQKGYVNGSIMGISVCVSCCLKNVLPAGHEEVHQAQRYLS